MFRTARFAMLALSVAAVGCVSVETTAPALADTKVDVRLSAVAANPVASLSDPNVNVQIAVRSDLPETVTGGRCANVIEARQPNGTTWTNVTSADAACSTIAIVLAPGATVSISASGSQAAIRAMAGSGSSVVLRARHTLSGASTSYTLQTNEVTMALQ